MNYSIMETQFHGEYRAVFSKALSYLFTQSFHAEFADEKMADLYDLLLTAQSQNTPVERVTGKDTEQFCREFFSDYTWKDRLISVAERLKTVAWIMLVLEILMISGQEHPIRDFFSIETNLAGYGMGIIGGVVMLLVLAFLRPKVLHAKKMTSGKWALIICGIFIVLIAVLVILFGDTELMLPAAPAVFGCIGYLLVYYITAAVLRYRKYGTVRNVRGQLYKDAYYKNLPDKDLERQNYELILKAWKKRYARKIRKGSLTEEQCLQAARDYERFERIGSGITNVLFVLIPLAFVIQVFRESAWWDALIFTALLGALEFAIWRFFRKINVRQAACRMEMLNECEQRGMTLPAYIEEKLNAPDPAESPATEESKAPEAEG